jgi:hypothetical protein
MNEINNKLEIIESSHDLAPFMVQKMLQLENKIECNINEKGSIKRNDNLELVLLNENLTTMDSKLVKQGELMNEIKKKLSTFENSRSYQLTPFVTQKTLQFHRQIDNKLLISHKDNSIKHDLSKRHSSFDKNDQKEKIYLELKSKLSNKI